MNVTELRHGNYFTEEGNLYWVLDILLNKTAMRKIVAKVKIENIRTGAITEMSANSGYQVETIRLDKKKMNYLYDSGDFLVFMDNETYDQVSIPKERLKWELNFLKDGVEAMITSYEGEIMGVELPVKIPLKVVHTDDAVKGDTINKAMKDATLETGYVCKVPLFVKNDTVIYVRTDNGEYDSRA